MTASAFGAIECEDRCIGLRASVQGTQRSRPRQTEATALRIDPGIRRKREKAGAAETIPPEHRESRQTLTARDQHAAEQPAEGTQYDHPFGEKSASGIDEQDERQAMLHRLVNGDGQDFSLGAADSAGCHSRVSRRQDNAMTMDEAAYRDGCRRPQGQGGGKRPRVACKIPQALARKAGEEGSGHGLTHTDKREHVSEA
jgi:hypothetical protein